MWFHKNVESKIKTKPAQYIEVHKNVERL